MSEQRWGFHFLLFFLPCLFFSVRWLKRHKLGTDYFKDKCMHLLKWYYIFPAAHKPERNADPLKPNGIFFPSLYVWGFTGDCRIFHITFRSDQNMTWMGKQWSSTACSKTVSQLTHKNHALEPQIAAVIAALDRRSISSLNLISSSKQTERAYFYPGRHL